MGIVPPLENGAEIMMIQGLLLSPVYESKSTLRIVEFYIISILKELVRVDEFYFLATLKPYSNTFACL